MSEIQNEKRGVALWVQVLVWLVIVSLLVLVGSTLSKRQQGSIQPGDTLPDFSLTFFEGYEYEGKSSASLSDFAGKVVVLNFWASWCKPCEQEAAELEEAWRFFKGEVMFLGVDYVDTEPEARTYLKKFQITYPNAPDLRTELSQMFRITGVPETYFIDQQGVLYYVKVGPFLSIEEIKSIIEQKLK
jgi:cytochrome c biogenesis protein CcmG, thiol:disulfide interchange protein DsbE